MIVAVRLLVWLCVLSIARVSSTCPDGLADCDGNVLNGCETFINTTSSCGECYLGCYGPQSVCVRRTVSPTLRRYECACNTSGGWASCDVQSPNIRLDGCPTNTVANNTHCGQCGRTCGPNSNCRNGACACDRNWADCDGDPSNGCEAFLLSDSWNCGACGRWCYTSCSAGDCTECSEFEGGAFQDCALTGLFCETDVRYDRNNCGECGRVCPTGLVCSERQCKCPFGTADCTPLSPGCETDATTLTNCARCGNACDTRRPNTIATCDPSEGCVYTCSNGFANCDNITTNGCETTLATSVAHCGQCGRSCSVINPTFTLQVRCTQSRCTANCAPGRVSCPISDRVLECADLSTSTFNCGACGIRCGPGQVCRNGTCVCADNTGECYPLLAPDVCIPLVSRDHCGACNNSCAGRFDTLPNVASSECSNMTCRPVCRVGYGNCDGNPSNGCEVALASSAGNCGACGLDCAAGISLSQLNALHVSVGCSNNTCTTTCLPGRLNCNGDTPRGSPLTFNGCESSVTMTESCGACGFNCTTRIDPLVTRSASCGNTNTPQPTCSFQCVEGRGTCYSVPANGSVSPQLRSCQTDLTSDILNCGTCSNRCPANTTEQTYTCTNSTCVRTCNHGYVDNGNACLPQCANGGFYRPFETTCTCSADRLWTGVLCNIPNQCTFGYCLGGSNCSINAAAGYTPVCTCPQGFTGARCDIDINECEVNNGGCSTLRRCFNTVGSRVCGACQSGYVSAQDGLGCIDINECEVDNGGCSALRACNNVLGSFFCAPCPTGFTSLLTGPCIDVNECATNNGGCNAANCSNLPGSYLCSTCQRGFTQVIVNEPTNATACIDINECATFNGGCDVRRPCVNTPGSFSCQSCPQGWANDGIYSCVDINECTSNNGGCSLVGGVCTNTVGSLRCSCTAGFTLSAADNRTCTDINECASNNGGCTGNAVCSNTVGSRTCVCPVGFLLDPLTQTACLDINECDQPETYGCWPERFVCTNTIGNFTCVDINECATNNGGCSSQRTCSNTFGNFSCGACPSGFVSTLNGLACLDINECATNNGGCALLGGVCTNTNGSRTCTCDAGYLGSGLTCIDINECATNQGGCSSIQSCRNNNGSYVCDCGTGYIASGASCVDLDECSLIPPVCDPLTTCENTVGGFRCSACPRGYTGSGRFGCADINECSNNNGGCSDFRACQNVPGSFLCVGCRSGFTPERITYRVPCARLNCPVVTSDICVDINECLEDNGGCHPARPCINTIGSSECALSCNSGWRAVGATDCVDINECEFFNGGCQQTQTCINTPGGFTCGPCLPGYEFEDTIGQTGDCVDIDECVLETQKYPDGYPPDYRPLCDPVTQCINTDGSYTCTPCPIGYNGTSQTGCIEINECQSYADGCPSMGSYCKMINGVKGCLCEEGYVGDGTFCGDLDECVFSPCDSAVACVNTNGSFYCEPCPPGGVGNSLLSEGGCRDVNECRFDNGGCDTMSTVCINNRFANVTCACRPGYVRSSVSNTTCDDVNECSVDNGGCSGFLEQYYTNGLAWGLAGWSQVYKDYYRYIPYECVNTNGSRVCVAQGGCPCQYYQYDNSWWFAYGDWYLEFIVSTCPQMTMNCQPPVYNPVCIYQSSLSRCASSEFVTYNGCEPQCSQCINGFASPSCQTCQVGLALDQTGETCIPICQVAKCVDQSTCTFNGTNALCDACLPGYALPDCIECDYGFIKQLDGTCVDACELANCLNSTECYYNGTTAVCLSCPSGFSPPDCTLCERDKLPISAGICVPYDTQRCGETHINCTAEYGPDYVCAARNASSTDFLSNPVCVLDSCSVSHSPCNLTTNTCTRNLVGEPICNCRPGFRRDTSGTCIDIDECATGTNNCSALDICFNTFGSFYCERLFTEDDGV